MIGYLAGDELPPAPDDATLAGLAAEAHAFGEVVDLFREPAAWGADWDRDELIARAVEMAELGFGIVRVYHPQSADRCSCGDPHDGTGKPDLGPKSIGKHPAGDAWQARAVHDPERVRTMMGNPGNRSYGTVPPVGTFEWDIDGTAPAKLAELERTLGTLPATRRHASGNGEHAFYRWPDGIPGGSGNLFGIVTRWAPGGMVVGPGSVHAATGKVYRVVSDAPIAELPRAWAEAAAVPAPRATAGDSITIDCLACGHLEERYGTNERYPAILSLTMRLHTMGHAHEVQWEHVRDHLAPRFDPAKSEAELLADFASATRDPVRMDRKAAAWQSSHQPEPEPAAEPPVEPGAAEPATWPDPPADAAYHGVLGDIAGAVTPYTEADPVGVLGTLLAMFGAACGGNRTLYQGSQQRTNLSAVLVGATGFGGRKGTALDVARAVFRLAYPDLASLWLVGVASGEAITGHLGRHDGQEGRPFEDRILIVEPEFGRLLTIMNREGSTLSAVLRNAWDGVPLGHARARDESLVSRHHVTMLGHVTPVELRAKLTDTDAANGFANRLLFLAVRRSRLVPFPTAPDELVRAYVEPLHRAIVEARTPAEMSFDADACDRWEDFYAQLALTPRLGLAGAVTGRHEAQVARLALVYALADRSAAVGAVHLEAAIALADYARRSATWALGDSTGNRHADVLRRMLADGEIGWKEAKLALGLRTAADMAEVVAVLVDAGLAEVARVPRDGPGGRPRQVIRGRAKDAKGAKDARGART